MRYKKFIVKSYRGVSDITEINLEKESLIPIIGKNESGKTTFLEAINSFDFYNDKDNSGKHLLNVENYYSTIKTPIIVAAEVEIGFEYNFETHFEQVLNDAKEEFLIKNPDEAFTIEKFDFQESGIDNLKQVEAYKVLVHEVATTKSLLIERDLKTKKYNIPILKEYMDGDLLNSIGESIVKGLPYILYFDDFRDRIPEKVYIVKDEDSPLYTPWIPFIEELFIQTNENYSVYSLKEEADNIRRSIITEVQEYLNTILIEEWAKYQFENSESIYIKLDYQYSDDGFYLQFKVIEKVYINNQQKERNFDISDRSKGFYWYFNFMMKLHFNPSKRDANDIDTIYLLDEPGSYLHTYALNKLAEQLRSLSLKNKVIYCTHSHNLLNPEFIPLNAIRIAEKIDKGKIILKRVDEASLIRPQKNSAYQPILDALEVKPPLVEYDFDNVILLEGIYDFYSFKMFTSDSFSYFPCVSASSIINQIPYMIFLQKKYLALWDNDDEGRARMSKAKDAFGEVESEKFMLLYDLNGQKNVRLEDYYEKKEVENFISSYLKLANCSLYKMILKLFYDFNKENLITEYFPLTKKNFIQMEKILKEKLHNQVTSQLARAVEQLDSPSVN